MYKLLISDNIAIQVRAGEGVEDVINYLEQKKETLGAEAVRSFIYLMKERNAKGSNEFILNVKDYLDTVGKVHNTKNVRELATAIQTLGTTFIGVTETLKTSSTEKEVLTTYYPIIEVGYVHVIPIGNSKRKALKEIRIKLGNWWEHSIHTNLQKDNKAGFVPLPPKALQIDTKKHPYATPWGLEMLRNWRFGTKTRNKEKRTCETLTVHHLYQKANEKGDGFAKVSAQIDKRGLFNKEGNFSNKSPLEIFIKNMNVACEHFNMVWEWKEGHMPYTKKDFLSTSIQFASIG